jgi:hexosaminidase
MPALAALLAASALDLLPVPARSRPGSGHLRVDEGFAAAAVGRCDDRVPAGLARLRRVVEASLGAPLRAGAARRPPSLVVDCAAPGASVQAVGEDESYRLAVTRAGARLTAPTSLGALRGLATFEQLLARDGGRLVAPAVTVEDAPRFPWRGLLLDVARHFMPVEVVKRTLDGMAAVKLNVLHWHLTEDQGFRVETRTFPRLHEAGSDGLFYTQAQVREVLAHARDRGIRVVPEFDMPGHTTAWLVGHPELASAPGPYAILRRWGVHDPTLDPTREEVYSFLEGFLREMAGLFPDLYVHIGGDEVTGRHWREAQGIQAFMTEKGLADVHALQAHFNARVSRILEGLGKRMIGWDEVLHPDLPRTTMVQSWRGAEGLAQAARAGHDALLSHGYYLDHMLPASAHYAVDPLPADAALTEGERARILGGEACMWAEYVTPETVDSRLWPRAAAVAERLWSPAPVTDVEDLYRRLGRQEERLVHHGIALEADYAAKLDRLAGGKAPEALRVLADLVEPVKRYQRGRSRAYTQETPLDRLVDAARPESEAARLFRRDVDRYLAAAPRLGSTAALASRLKRWSLNQAALEPLWTASPVLAEAAPLSADLAMLGRRGLEALNQLSTRRPAAADWTQQALASVRSAALPRAEVEIAAAAAVGKLVLAASRWAELDRATPAEWNASLDTAVADALKRPEAR